MAKHIYQKGYGWIVEVRWTGIVFYLSCFPVGNNRLVPLHRAGLPVIANRLALFFLAEVAVILLVVDSPEGAN